MQPLAQTPRRARRAPLVVSLLIATGLAGCGEERVVYDRPDASAWGPRCERASLPDGGVGNVAYVSNSLMNSVSVLDLAAGRTLATHPVSVGPLAENGPHHLAIDLAAGVLYSPLSFPAPAIPAGPHAEHGSAASPGVFVKRSLCDFRLLGQIDLDPNPGDLVLSPDGGTVWVGCTVSGLLLAYDVAAGRFDETRLTRRLPGKPYFPGFSPDGATMVVPTQGRDSLARVTTRAPLTVLQQVAFAPDQCVLPHQVAYGPDGLYYLVCEGRQGTNPALNQPGTVLALNPDDLSVVRQFTVGVFPDAIVFARPRP